MGLYDDEDQAVTEGPIDHEAYYRIKVWEKWLAVAMKQRMPETNVKRICEQIVEFADQLAEKFSAHKEVATSKEKANKLIGKIEGYSASTEHSSSTPGWHQDVWRKGWADGFYALYLHSQNRTSEAKSRAENCIWRVRDSWMKDEDCTKHVTYPKADLEDIVAKVAPIAAG
jgi:hypothetical protein